ncbi:hypothetical protein LZ554_009349 [Drepanopeziza brunnea f. sp. 'monogermtubi']|nr:hypothetical protein LZ554_009349 [Drepanopeziza brunnea f. sp. 'monogermtubi']
MSDLHSGAEAPWQDSSDTDTAHSYDSRESDRPKAALSKADLKTQDRIEIIRGSEKDAKHGKFELPTNTTPEEVERLRAAMSAQLQLNQHRERLARQLGGATGEKGVAGTITPTGKSRASPIHEETISPSLEEAFATPINAGLETTSTESAKTIRGGITPGLMAARTPSYPFPPMRTPGQLSFNGHRPFTALSPTVNPSNYAGGSFNSGLQDRVLSGSSTPASTMRFQPTETSESPGDPNFEAPNLYDLSLMLSSEPGLDPWWTTVVEIMRSIYHAHRVTLSVPADPTDVENVPWGQKATFNAVGEDELSLAYLPRGSSLVPSSGDTNDTSNSEDTNQMEEASPMYGNSLRPGLQSRHSFTAYEDTKRDPISTSLVARAARPSPLVRAKSYLSARPDLPPRTATLQNAELSLQSLQEHMAFEDAKRPTTEWENRTGADRDVKGRIFSVLQALDYEAESLIDNRGVSRVVERGKVIALTRDYPYVETSKDEKSGSSKSSNPGNRSKGVPIDEQKTPQMPDIGSRVSSFFGGRLRKSSSPRTLSEKGKGLSMRAVEDVEGQALPRYEEYEQAPPSPWSQSPAPSPAIRVETSDNPFFANIPIDEETFNPQPAPADYADLPPPQTIGNDRSWTVLHVPLIHPLLSKPVQSFRLDAAAMEFKSAGRGRGNDNHAKDGEERVKARDFIKEKQTPIAILSILSPVIPYPSTLRRSLEHLAPHLATSFSLCRHFTNLETEVSGLSRKRPQTAGFGAVAGGHIPEDRLRGIHPAYWPTEENASQQSAADSITSPSDYSGVSRSTAGSPAGTPGWDPGSVGLSLDKRSSGGSPGFAPGEGYFSNRTRPGAGRVDTGSASCITGARQSSKESSPADTRSQRLPRTSEEKSRDPETPTYDHGDGSPKDKYKQDESSSTITPRKEPRCGSPSETTENRDVSPSRQVQDTQISPRRLAMRTASNQWSGRSERQHTQLHSYGADFGATFQSLPATTPSTKGPSTAKAQPQPVTSSVAPEYMPPPSDRVKGIMLDSLPMHIFIALPPTGEMVWVNSRYLTYRGQGVKDLHEDPWASIHPAEREDYLRAWGHAIRSGEQFSIQVRLRRFDGAYRWFYTRAVGLRDSRGVIVQWYGTHMDIHDQHIAEVKAARQEEIEASEAKHRLLANLIPQIIFSATEDQGVTFANQQWLSYTGQDFEDAMGLGFMDFVHPDDLARCRIPTSFSPIPSVHVPRKPSEPSRNPSQASSGGISSKSVVSDAPTERTIKGVHQSLSRTNSSSGGSIYEFPSSDLSELMKAGVIKVEVDGNGRTSYSTEVRLRSKSGEYRWHLVRCVEIDNINLGIGNGSWFGACADINDHKLLEMKLKDAMESKSKFLSNMSHEIRTPLIGISGMITFLQDSQLDDDQIDFCNTIASSAEGLLNIINDILDLAKADAGMMKLQYDWFHTRSLVEEVNEMVSTIAMTKHLEVNYVVDPEVPDMVKGDRFRVRQVLLNVIGNAIKFTDSGEVFSRCTVLKEQSANAAENEIILEFSIIDTGRGFTQEEAEKIFKPFSQIDASSTRTQGGTGLGLVISRQLVELHGGMMEGTATPGKGATFTFSIKFQLPTAEDHPPPSEIHTPSTVPSTRASLRSLVSYDTTARAIQQAGGNPILASRLFSSSPTAESPRTESSSTGSQGVRSSSSSAPSFHSTRSQTTHRSSSSSLPPALASFGEAARVIATDPLSMKLELPDRLSPTSVTEQLDSTSPNATPTPTGQLSPPSYVLDAKLDVEMNQFRPPMYSILLICPQEHSREATTQHIEMTLPKDVPHKITGLASVDEARTMIAGENPILFTHIVLNLGVSDDIVVLVDQIMGSIYMPSTSIVVLSDPVQRQEVMKMATDYNYDQLARDNRLTFIYKPVKPSKFAVIFDPDKERDLSTDRNRFQSQQQVARSRQNYSDIRERVGDRGYLALLVEDNLTNQKVLRKFLDKIGIRVEVALDGVECTDKVFSKPHGFYSLILCDLHMPNKDGYQTCREIRAWERNEKHPRMPILALSANVMAEVKPQCDAAGFDEYITKPVDFKSLSTAMINLLDPKDPKAAARVLKGFT